jgi:Gas vesicle protein G
MGVITGLLTLPLSPLRGTVRLAAMLERQAEHEAYDETAAIQAALLDLDALRDTGDQAEEEIEWAEDELLKRLVVVRGLGEAEGHGHGA